MRLLSYALTLGLLVGSVVALDAQGTDPRVGTWTVNLAKSKWNPGPAPKAQTLRVEAVGQGEKAVVENVSADGTRIVSQYTANYDGKDYPLTGYQDVDTVSLKRIDARTTERVDKKAGKTVRTFRRVVSQDGKTMTVTMTGTNPQGQVANDVNVFEKK